ncbi:MAG: hypothetical protein GXO90_06620 [FCB group bacterium]|nr:hypothetical protein [FCB group bacterium]
MSLPEWAPGVHPLIIHFPLVILLGAILVNLGELFIPWLKRQPWIGTALYGIGWLTAGIAWLAGREAADAVTVADEILPAISRHSDLATQVLILFGTVLVIRLAINFLSISYRYAIGILALIVALGGGKQLVATGDQGAKLVYKYGVGVQKSILEEKPAVADYSFIADDASWDWVLKGAVPAFDSIKGRWVGDTSDWKKVAEGERSLDAQETVAFFSPLSLENLSGKLSLETDSLGGMVELFYNYKDEGNYDYLTLSDGEIRLGRKQKGNDKIFESKSVKIPGFLTMKVVASGNHLRGYVNDELVIHTHKPPEATGETGFRISGPGRIRLIQAGFKSLTAAEH